MNRIKKIGIVGLCFFTYIASEVYSASQRDYVNFGFAQPKDGMVQCFGVPDVKSLEVKSDEYYELRYNVRDQDGIAGVVLSLDGKVIKTEDYRRREESLSGFFSNAEVEATKELGKHLYVLEMTDLLGNRTRAEAKVTIN